MNVVSAIRNVLLHPTERRLRAPFRIAGGGIVLLVTVLVAQVAVVFGLGGGSGMGPGTEFDAGSSVDPASSVVLGLSVVAGGIAVMGVLVPIARFIDRRRAADYGFRLDRNWWIDCGFGLALGVGLQAAIFIVGWAAGWFTVTGTFRAAGSFLPAFAALVGLFLVVGVYEEALIRGWLLTNLAEGLRFVGTAPAVLVSVAVTSGLFGLLHAGNPGATPLSVGIISLAGVLLAAGYLLTGELAIPIGIHVTWNLAQGAVFGHGVSGLGAEATVVATETTGPELWTGGGFGPEGGLLGAIGVLVGCVAVAVWVRFRTGDLRLHPAVTTPELRGDRPREGSDGAGGQ